MNKLDIQDCNEYQFKGIHFFASYIDCKKLTLSQIDQLRSTMELAVKESGATMLKVSEYIFESAGKPELPGYTSAYILSESHATIHTYPEVDRCFVDLFTCGTHCSHEKFDNVLRQYLQPKSVSYQVIERESDMKTLELKNNGYT